VNEKKKSGIRMLLYFRFTIVSSFILALFVTGAVILVLSRTKLLRGTPSMTLMLCLMLMCTLISGAVTLLMSRKILRPVVKLNEALATVAKGDFSVRLDGESQIKEIRQSFNNFNAMAKELAASETLQKDFVTNVSHEFKTPINAIEGYATLLQSDGELPPDQAENVEKILLNTRRLSELAGNIMLLSKLENLVTPLKRERYRLDEEVRRAILALETRWTQKDIGLDVELDELNYTGNRTLMIHVWQNLLDNAIKFCPEGGTIRLRLRREENTAVFQISDTGPGIDPDALGHVFEKFYQGDTSHKAEGNGLGLPLAKYIVELHGGEILAGNSPEGGGEFTVRLPII